MRQLLIATRNSGKLSELRSFLSDLPLKIVSLADLKIQEKTKETGKTYEENAVKKARFYARKSGLPTIADDGGIEIRALGGEPGIKSRRWVDGKAEASDEELISYTLKRLKNIPPRYRQAQFRAVLALAIPGNGVYTSEGIVKGIIAQKPIVKRKRGYPYRSLFYLPPIKKYYLEDELTPKETQKYNHRAKAIKRLKKIIQEKVLK